MSLTIASPPVRPPIKSFTITQVSMSAAGISCAVQMLDASARDHGSISLRVVPGGGFGVRWAADGTGSPENYDVVDATITIAAAFTAFVGTAGAFAAKADALAVYLQSKALLPT